MAEKLVGKYGSVFLRSIVTRKGGSVLPVSRPSRKLEAALPLLMGNVSVDNGSCTVDINVNDVEQLYELMRRLGYTWNLVKWERNFSYWMEVS